MTGLKTVITDKQWEYMTQEFDINFVISSKNAYNETTQAKFSTGAIISGGNEKQGKLVYKIYNYDYEIV